MKQNRKWIILELDDVPPFKTLPQAVAWVLMGLTGRPGK
jgi:hypothetical protein